MDFFASVMPVDGGAAASTTPNFDEDVAADMAAVSTVTVTDDNQQTSVVAQVSSDFDSSGFFLTPFTGYLAKKTGRYGSLPWGLSVY